MRLLAAFLFPTLLCAQDWLRLSDFPGTKRDDGVAVLVGDKAYFGSGLQEGWWFAGDFHALDLGNFSWSTISGMPHATERQYASAFPGNNCFFVFGGEGFTSVLNDMYRYNIAADTWSQVASKPGGGVMAASCMNFGDKVIIAGGKVAGPGPATSEVWEYTISTDSWLRKADYPFPARWRSCATVLNNKGYLLFGIDDSNAHRRELYKYDPGLDSWTKESDFPGDGRAYAAMEANTKLLVFGGHGDQNKYYNDVWYYSDSSGVWLQGPSMSGLPRRTNMSCLKDEKFVISCGLGQGDARLNETWLLDAPVGLGEIKSEVFEIYPNPVGDELHITFINAGKYKLSIKSLSGSDLMDFDANGVTSVVADLRGLQPGIYFLSCTGGSTQSVKKIIRQ
jgi:N-acetylneuraminic acid mutarotase